MFLPILYRNAIKKGGKLDERIAISAIKKEDQSLF